VFLRRFYGEKLGKGPGKGQERVGKRPVVARKPACGRHPLALQGDYGVAASAHISGAEFFMAHIVLTGINTLRNRGVEALLVSIVQGLRGAFPDPRITLLLRDPEGAKAALEGTGVTIVADGAWSPPVDATLSKKALFRLKRWVRTKVLGRLTASERALATADLVIGSGGDIFSSDYGIMERYLRQYDQPQAAGVPVYLVAQSIGPFKTAAEKASFSAVARQGFVSVRETISYDYLIKDLGIPADRVELTADPAFLLAVPEATKTAMLARYGLSAGSYTAAAISRGISGFKGIGHEGHLAAWVAAAHAILERTAKLVLVPHVQLPHEEEDDLSLAREIRAAMGDDPRVVIIDGTHSAVEFKAVLGQAAFAVAERTHGAIGAMSSGVPTLSIGYSIKAEGILRQLIAEEDLFDLSLLPVTEFTPENAAAVVAASWDARNRFAAELQKTLPLMRERAARNYAKAVELVTTKR
jgi:colanic acid/amylovoran biosynthesis protein